MEITRLVAKEKKGLIVVITGYGKGKTTSALGIAVRACGHIPLVDTAGCLEIAT